MRVADLIDFITGARPDFHQLDATVQPGDKFGRHEAHTGWTYVEVSAFNDGRLRQGCFYARAFSRAYPAGREGYCHRSQLGLRIDDATWTALRAANWPAPGVVLGIGAADAPAPEFLDDRPLIGPASASSAGSA